LSLPQKHRDETERLIRLRSATKDGKTNIAEWLLNEGYYPEQYVLPPCFEVDSFSLEDSPNVTDLNNLRFGSEKQLRTISFPKTGLIQRVFGIIHPKYYHDIVYHFIQSWETILDKLFDAQNRIYSYSFPIPLSRGDDQGVGKLRSGRMIYEFLEMAEKDLVAESHRFKFLAKIDITNFYNSIYTHSIAWAWYGDRKKAGQNFKDFNELGNQLDKLFQYSNDARTSGLPVGPVVSDLVVELILSERDKVISERLKGLDFVATRFKDDYRFLVHSEKDGAKIIKTVIEVLGEFNLHVNEQKTSKAELPDSLYRDHSQKYEPFSLKRKPFDDFNSGIPFKVFESTLLKTLEIHREHRGTSIIEKFISELTMRRKNNGQERSLHERIRIEFVSDNIPINKRERVLKTNIRKAISLLLHLKNESPKALANVLSIIECLYLHPDYQWLKEEEIIKKITEDEIKKAILKNSAFDLIWWLYFNCRHQLGLDFGQILKNLRKDGLTDKTLNDLPIVKNPFIITMRGKKPGKGNITDPFEGDDHSLYMFKNPEECGYLLDHLDIFNRDEEVPEN